MLKNYITELQRRECEDDSPVSDPDSDYSKSINKKIQQDNISESTTNTNFKFKNKENVFRCKKENKIRELYDHENIESFIKDTQNYNNLFYDYD